MDFKDCFNPNELSQIVQISNLVVAFFLHENVHKMIGLSTQLLVFVRQGGMGLIPTVGTFFRSPPKDTKYWFKAQETDS
ncbi:hypothetical protein DPMN_125963 [Dreissena polymorpha]|uniref:Uncharacterized protein n=1 Tax=Dreissena polymorpha TaxID=45954 RepID=A0A9D4JV63_DREPO|nr:hypothetical protein DPMN_125963 [Dreissena polymorpha]